MQIQKSTKLNIKENTYFEIISKKTAVLIASCCACGASAIGKEKKVIEKARLFGENVGIAFQIKDDLFDYTASNFIGKPTGIDLREKKMTLPLIYTLSIVDKKTKNLIINIVKNHNKNDQKIQYLIQLVKDNGGLEYAKRKMADYHQKSLEILKSFPENKYRTSLELLVNYVIERKK